MTIINYLLIVITYHGFDGGDYGLLMYSKTPINRNPWLYDFHFPQKCLNFQFSRDPLKYGLLIMLMDPWCQLSLSNSKPRFTVLFSLSQTVR